MKPGAGKATINDLDCLSSVNMHRWAPWPLIEAESHLPLGIIICDQDVNKTIKGDDPFSEWSLQVYREFHRAVGHTSVHGMHMDATFSLETKYLLGNTQRH